MNQRIILYLCLLAFGIAAPFLFPAFKLQISIMWILVVLSLTWDVQGGQMGYNTFGNILFFRIGMYLCSSVQIGLFFPLAEWTASGGEKTFVHTPKQFFQGFFVGLILAGIVPALVAAFIGYGILGLRGHYFAICTLGLGIAAGEIAGGIELIGAGQGMTSPPWPKGIGDTELRSEFFYYICFIIMICTFLFLRWAYQTRFGLVLNVFIIRLFKLLEGFALCEQSRKHWCYKWSEGFLRYPKVFLVILRFNALGFDENSECRVICFILTTHIVFKFSPSTLLLIC